jgi:hypothetical protein
MQGSTLCRLVTQLKSMVGRYPDESTLEMIISSQYNLAIGDPPQETIERISDLGRPINRFQAPVQAYHRQTINNNDQGYLYL